MTALLEIVAAGGIGIFLGIVLKASFTAAIISRSQERILREAARARENTDWQPDYERLPL